MRKDIESFDFFKSATGYRGVPFLAKTCNKGKCYVHWSDGLVNEYEIFQRALNGPLGAHMDEQLMDYFKALSSSSKSEFNRGRYIGNFGPVDYETASDVFAVVNYHFRTALEWMIEAGVGNKFSLEEEAQMDRFYRSKKQGFCGKWRNC